MDAAPRLGLSHWLTFLVIGTTVPLLLFAGATLYKMSRDARAARDQSQAETARALALALDGEVRAWKAVVTALAESQSLRPDRLAEFYAEAQRVAAPHDGWVVLTVASGEQLLNTLRPYGAPLAKTSSPETIAAVFREGKPVVSDIVYGQNAQQYLVAVAVPVVRGGKVVNCLTLNFAPQRLTRVLQGQQVPLTWVAAINDRQGRVVARSQHIEQRIGKPTVPWLAEAIRTAEDGIAIGPLTDGRLGQVAFHRLHEVPWTVTLSIPVAELPSAQPVQRFTLFALLLGVAGVGAALYASRRIAAPIGRLAANAAALVRGEALPLDTPLPVRELESLQQVLVEASGTAQALQREQSRAAVAEERAKAAASAVQASREHAQALQVSEARFREIFEYTTDAILVTDPTGAGRILAVNPAACRLFGYTEAAFIGLTREATLETTDGHATAMLHTREQNGRARAELTYIRKDGTRFPGELTSAVFTPSGEPQRAVAIIRDITERKRAEIALQTTLQRFYQVLASMYFGILLVSDEGRVEFANQAFCDYYGLKDAPTDLVGLASREMLTKIKHGYRYPDEAIARILEILKRGLPVLGEELDLQGRQTVLRDFVPLNVHGESCGRLWIHVDITAHKQAEEALQQAKDELEQRVQDRTAALAEQASQLQSLTAELALAEQRERQRLAHVLHDGLQQLLVAAKLRLASLPRADAGGVAAGCRVVAGLLEEALASSRSLTGELSPPILQTGGLAAGLEWLVRWKAEKYQLAVELQADPLAVPDSEAMTLLLFQSVRELLFNVVKHAQVQAARVEVRRHDGHLQIVVSDRGVGFDPATLPPAGTGGLGLSSIRQRLEFLGGCVGIVAAPGEGCRITLAAPLGIRMSAPPASTADPMDRPAPPRPRRGAKIRVLLVDDHAVMRHALAQLLNAEPDLEVVGEAADGQAGVARTKALSPHVVLMDINLPGLNGIDATTQVRAACPGVQVIGLSMFAASEQTAAMQEAGAVAYVSKSAPAEELLAVIRASVDATPPSARPPHARPADS